ncbi:TetR/AcrR family transcriptional regulator [Nocardioides sp. Kera G14]|uniref:TetR/AcrR family transcriptional regulator n=1 Tax=Nocardioides sp. Kera G14 TaxID=2884264 RepID=UPI001D121717|nr:TetR/AcrR family transcriptional regulator [Nocardioides sp. Kera G14]UDY22189.1 TetR/AcrR family transcriptional regulator [Nocardioides sp. Kera G14]
MPPSADSPRDGRQTRWDGHKEERRRHIIAAAIDIAQRSEPGTEIHIQEIAEHAGLSRTVVYRHFADRADLDRAVQATILEGVWALLLPEVRVEGTVPEIIGRIISAYVTWAVDHPALHRLADHDTSHDHGPLEEGLDRLAEQITELVLVALPVTKLENPDEFIALVDPMVYGIVGAAFSAVRRWISRPEQVLPAEGVAHLVTESIWFVIQGHAANFGVELTRDLRMEDLLASALATDSLPT